MKLNSFCTGKLIGGLAAGLTLALAALPAEAITFGVPDGEKHPYVGLAIFDVGGEPAWRCSGTLLSPTIFLTAAHCTYEAEAARVWFDADLTSNPEYPYDGSTSYAGVPITHPGFTNTYLPQTNSYDIGIIRLTEPVPTDIVNVYGELPTVSYLDNLDSQKNLKPQNFTVVGYGWQDVLPEPITDLVRYQAEPTLVNFNSAVNNGTNIQLSNNANTGGTCYGDSGGPALYSNNSNVVLGITSYGPRSCGGIGYYYRVDTPGSLAFIDYVVKNGTAEGFVYQTNNSDSTQNNRVSDVVFIRDELGFGSIRSVPEPASVFSLLAFSAFGAGSVLKRKQQQKKQVTSLN